MSDGRKRVYLGILLLFGNFLQNHLMIFFICIQHLGDDISQLSRDGIDLIDLKVIIRSG